MQMAYKVKKKNYYVSTYWNISIGTNKNVVAKIFVSLLETVALLLF